MSLTLVTCWWDLESRGADKGRRDFATLGEHVLSLPIPMVIFCDPWVSDSIKSKRNTKIPTTIIDIPLEKLEWFSRWNDKVRTCSLPGNRNMPKDSHTFLAMGWSKPGMMLEVARNNPHSTTHVGWIDLGIYHALSYEGTRPNNSLCDLSNFDHTDDKIRFHVLRCIDGIPAKSDYYHNIWCLVAAGYIVGSCEKVIEFANDFSEEAERVIAGGHVSIDEDLFAMLIHKAPEKYTYSYGNYCDILSNHHQVKTNEDYLRWMVEDARGRGCMTFANKLEAQIPNKLNLIKLHMIVKNESQRIRKTLESVKPFIDSWCILDTGSTDGTQQIIKETLLGIPGNLYEESIITYKDTGVIDFAATRNRGLELAGTDSVFILLLNGDDSLLNGNELKTFCENHKDESDGAYFVRIVGCPRGEYDSSRLMRSSSKWRYSLPTHEVLSGSSSIRTRATIQIHHEEAPLENRIYRWKQDLIIFNRYLIDHPDDVRAIYYLAQTHECLGNHKEAFDLYVKRAAMGGWDEEIYEAKRRAAQCANHLGRPWAEVQQLYLEAYASLPRRAEALHTIADYWYKKNNHYLTYLFASRANAIPYPDKDIYMVDKEVYEWRAADLTAISGFYIGEKEIGRRAALKVAKHFPDDNRIRRNLHFYARKLKDIVGNSYKEIDLSFSEPGWVSSTPSIYSNGLDTKVIIRMVNYRIKPDSSYDYDGTIRTRNFLLGLDELIAGKKGREIKDLTNIPRTQFPVHGFEDCRLFWWRECWWAVATVRDTTESGICEQVMLRLDDNGDVCEMFNLSRGLMGQEHQKNWKPAIDGDILKWIYSTDPLTVLEHNSAFKGPFVHKGRLLGSSQAVKVPHGWLWVDHSVSCGDQGRERIYAHHFVLSNDNLTEIISVSYPFYFEQLGIEFCAGLALIGDEITFSYSVHDATSKLVTIPMSAVYDIFEKAIIC